MSQVGRPVFQRNSPTWGPPAHCNFSSSNRTTCATSCFWWWIGAPKKTHPRLATPNKESTVFSLICPKMQMTMNYWRWVICDKSMYKHFVQPSFEGWFPEYLVKKVGQIYQNFQPSKLWRASSRLWSSIVAVAPQLTGKTWRNCEDELR